MDNLYAALLPGTPERENLDKEKNYVNIDVVNEGWPILVNSFDGVLASHCMEHWDCQQAVGVMEMCHAALKPGGVLLVSVPDASYFRKVHHEATVENAERLFGEPIHLADGETTFTGYALWCPGRHKAIISEDVLWHYFVRAGFKVPAVVYPAQSGQFGVGGLGEIDLPSNAQNAMTAMVLLLNRLPFSLVMCGVKE